MRKNNKILTLIIVALLLAGVVFVYIVTGRSDGTEQIVDRSDPTVAVQIANTEIPATDIQAAGEPTQAEVMEEQVVPTPRVGLQSTDPSTVNLASGQIQLVEVFAFW